jgi:hypothetical protein
MQTRRKVLSWLSSAAALALWPIKPSSAAFGIYTVSSTAAVATGFSQLKIGGGGVVTGVNIAPDGTRVCRCDTYGAYLWNASAASPGNAGGLGEWQCITTVNSLPSSIILKSDGEPLDSPTSGLGKGAYEIVVDPNNSNNLWMVFYGYVWRSTNKGSSWSQISISQIAQDTNTESNTGSNAREMGPHIAVDPINSDVVCVANTTGLYVTTNGTAAIGSVTFTKVSGITTPGNNGSGDSGGVLIAFDPSSAQTGGKTQGIYASSYGHGVYHTTGGVGGTWTLTTSSPTNHFNIACAPNGTLYWVDDTSVSTIVHKYNGSAWSTTSAGTGGNIAVAINPANGNVFVIDADGNLAISTNNGTSFANTTGYTIVAPDIPWLAQNDTASMFPSNIQFDPSQSNVLVQSWGFGIAYCNPPTTATTFNWNTQTAGIEQVVVIRIVSPPNGNPVVSTWDRIGFTIQNYTQYPSQQNCFYGSNVLAMGWGLDWASSAPANLVSYSEFQGGNNESGISTDKGVTWTKLGSTSYDAGQGGCLAAYSASFFLIQSANNLPQYTTNGGGSWTACPGAPANGSYQANNSFWPQLMACDRVDANTFYLFTGPIYKSTTNPPSFTQVSSGSIDTYGFNIPLLAAVPNLGTTSTSGHLFFSLGKGAGTAFRRSINHGTTWSTVGNFTEVVGFDFGPPGSGQSYPSIYVMGLNNSVWGLWRSLDNASTWTLLTTYPNNSFDTVTNVCADANTYGVVYVGFIGSGAARGFFP